MRIICFFRSTIWTLTIWCACVSLAWAVSIYDVIELSRQDYSDAEIVNIIETTRSVFKLAAEDIPRLKNLGVSEAVIRKMLESAPVELSGPDTVSAGTLESELNALFDSNITNSRSDDQIGATTPPMPKNRSHAAPGNDWNAVSPATSPDRFSVQTVLEEAAGDHEHAYVTLGGVPILIVRDEGRFQTIEDRGRAVVSNLEEARRMGEGRFKAIHADGADRVMYHSVNLREVLIVTVNRHDVYAYDVRSERRVTPDLLAYYWTALLNDYWDIAFRHRRPDRLIDLHRGEALMLLFEIVNGTAADQPQSLGLAVQQLPGPIQNHLERLATAVPDDFDIWSEYVGDKP